MLNHLHTRVEYAVHLTYYLSLRRHYPDQVHAQVFSWKSLVESRFDLGLWTLGFRLKQWV